MALLNCEECKSQISDTAKVCPKCGFKMKRKIGLGFYVFVILLVIVVFNLNPSNRGFPEIEEASTIAVEDQKAKLAKIGLDCMHEAGIPDRPDYQVSQRQLDMVSECTGRKMGY